MELVLIRHAQNALPNVRKAIDSQLIAHAALTSAGQVQAEQLAAALKILRPARKTALLSSPANRCALTAKEVGNSLGLDVAIEDRLSDRSPGALEFTNLEQYRQWQLDAWKAPDEKTAGSESLIAMRRRVRSWLVATQSLELDRAIVITHGSVIEQVTGILLGISTRRMATSFLQCDHAHFHRWDLRGADGAVLLESNVSPLAPTVTQKDDAHAAISRRLAAGSDASVFVVEKYYVR